MDKVYAVAVAAFSALLGYAAWKGLLDCTLAIPIALALASIGMGSVLRLYLSRSVEEAVLRHRSAVMRMLRHHTVAVMSNSKYAVGQKLLIDADAWVFRGVVTWVVQNTAENRERFYAISGFNDPDTWLEEMKRLYGRHPKHIVVINIEHRCVCT